MDEHFYLVPISNNSLSIKDISLIDMFREKYYKLFEIQMEQELIIQEIDSDRIFNLTKLIDNYYELYKIPKNLIIIEDDDKYIELVSGLEVNVSEMDELLKYQTCDANAIRAYYFASNYKEKLFNLFRTYGFLNRKGIIKKRLKK